MAAEQAPTQLDKEHAYMLFSGDEEEEDAVQKFIAKYRTSPTVIEHAFGMLWVGPIPFMETGSKQYIGVATAELL